MHSSITNEISDGYKILTDKDIKLEAKYLYKKIKLNKLTKILILIFAICLLTLTIIYAVFVNYFKINNLNVWIICILYLSFDLLLFIMTYIWCKNMTKKSHKIIPIPLQEKGLTLTSHCVNYTNVIITIISIFGNAKDNLNSEFEFILFSFQIIVIFVLWDVLIIIFNYRSEKMFINKLNEFAKFQFNKTNSYATMLIHNYYDCCITYDKMLYQSNINKKNLFIRLITFDFSGEKWKKQLINNKPFSLETCSKVFMNKNNKDLINEYYLFRFCIIIQLFEELYKADSYQNFVKFFWIRDTKIIKKFSSDLKKFNSK